jgi:ATP-dependent RNA helicase DDX24/MAK5
MVGLKKAEAGSDMIMAKKKKKPAVLKEDFEEEEEEWCGITADV